MNRSMYRQEREGNFRCIEMRYNTTRRAVPLGQTQSESDGLTAEEDVYAFFKIHYQMYIFIVMYVYESKICVYVYIYI